MIHNVRTVKPASFGVAVPKARVMAAARPSVKANFKITLETPEGTKEIECDGDTYIVDAAEVRTYYNRQTSVLEYYMRSNGSLECGLAGMLVSAVTIVRAEGSRPCRGCVLVAARTPKGTSI